MENSVLQLVAISLPYYWSQQRSNQLKRFSTFIWMFRLSLADLASVRMRLSYLQVCYEPLGSLKFLSPFETNEPSPLVVLNATHSS